MSHETEQMVSLTFSLPLSLKEKIEELARMEDRPVASFLRVELSRLADEKESLLQPATTEGK